MSHRIITVPIICIFLLTCLANVSATGRGGIIDYCNTPECVNFGNTLKESMNDRINPCEDFYTYACGGWIEKRPLAAGQRYRTKFTEWITEVNSRSVAIMKKPASRQDSQAYKKAKDMYSMCTGQIGTMGINDLKELIDNVGGWPILIHPRNSWNAQGTIRWQQISKVIDNYYFGGPFYSINHWANYETSKRQIEIKPPKMVNMDVSELRREFSADEHIIRKIANQLDTTFQLGIADDSIDQDISDIIAFSRQIAGLRPDSGDGTDMIIRLFQHDYDNRIKNFRNTNSEINWLDMIKNAYKMHKDITAMEEITVWQKRYFYKLGELLSKTPLRTIVNYMIWRFIRPLLDHIAEPLRVFLDFEPIGPNRDLQCLHEPNLKHVLYYEYIKLYASDDTRIITSSYINKVKTELMEQIDKSTWLDSLTKRVMQDKLGNLRIEVVGPTWYSDNVLDNYYADLQITRSYFDSAVNILKFEGTVRAKMLRTPLRITATTSDEWDIFTPLKANAAYDSNTNTICFPAAFLNGFFYHPNLPASLIFALLGNTAGHEISHAFDTDGKDYDKYGKRSPSWSANALAIYNRKADCFVRQYNGYYLAGTRLHIDGRRTLDENIADTGIITSYRAYKKFIRSNARNDQRLSNLPNFNGDQLFFLAYASSACQNYEREYMKRKIRTDKHPFSWARVRGALSNMPEFATAFNCKPGSPMNPSSRCTLW